MPETKKTMASLRNKFLIAMPTLQDPYFSRSVIYIHEHNEKGATGFIVNKPTNVTVADILKRIHIEEADQSISSRFTLLGGPVSQDQVFLIVHDQREKSPEAVLLSYSKEALADVVKGGREYQEAIFFLGYTSWEPGQLEQEIMDNGWLIAPMDFDVLFHLPYISRYQAAASLIGVDVNNLSSDVGHA